jgi:hypothetical protein
MSDTKKPRNMTPKGFLHKTTTKAALSAHAFLDQYREYLTTGELAERTSPILAKYDADKAQALAKMQDTNKIAQASLKEIAHAVMVHIIESDHAKMEEKLEEAQSPKTGTKKPWIATILDAAGNICTRVKEDGEEEELVKGFDHASEADRWVDRRLFEGASDWYGEIDHASLPIHTRIERQDAIARILKKAKGPTVQVRGKSTKTLGFEHKAKENRFYFSRG